MESVFLRLRRIESLCQLPHELSGPTPGYVKDHFLHRALLEIDDRLKDLEKHGTPNDPSRGNQD